MKRLPALLTAAAVAILPLAACGSDDSTDSTSSPTSGADASPTPAATDEPTTSAAPAPTTSEGAPAATAGDSVEGELAPQPLAEPAHVVVALAASGIEAYAQVLLADHFGEFERENLDVDIEVVPLGDAIALLATGDIDMVPAGANIPVLNAIAAGNDLAIVAAMPTFPAAPASKAGFWVTPDLLDDAGELDPCRLKDAVVSFGGPAGFASAASLPFAEFIAECDLTLNDIEVSTVGGPDALIALENDAIDAAYLPDPLWADPEQRGYASFAIPFGQASVGGYVMGPLRSEQPEVADALIRAMVRTTRTYLQGDYRNDPNVRAALEEVLGVGDTVLGVGASLVFDPDMRFDPVLIEPIQRVWIDTGLLSYDEPLPVERLVDETNLDRVLADG